ncbi:MAG TPA: HoxN/HupN/NixA family nickel/cobalt transporter [Thermoplasmata archaeon]|nr:HoxN/HupN/NixA family nickel/cobalt transporter [Thermoplasmata archaeon]
MIALATVLGFVASFLIGQQYPVLAGLGVTAYVLGLRHGFDADHIAAIDNTTRKLMHERRPTASVGTWFSLGHSTVVVAMIVALTLSVGYIRDQIPAFKSAGSILGAAVAGVFLWLIGLMNLLIVFEIYRIFRSLREGKLDEAHLEEALDKRGFLHRYFGRLFGMVRRAWQIYPIGVLFGLGFDTASEIALIAVTVVVATSSAAPLWMILLLPFLFACGMVLVDTSDSVVMTYAYGWAFRRPMRKVYYNLTVTIISILVAFLIGTIELLSVVVNSLGLTGGLWSTLGNVDFTTIGVAIVLIFVGSWGFSVAYYRYKRYDEIPAGA